MKIFLCFLAVLATVSCQNDVVETVNERLPHFDTSQLGESFLNFEGLPDSCSSMSESCISGGHTHAKDCIDLFYEEKGDDINECKEETEGLSEASQAWQEASLAWHKAVEQCLRGDDAPASEAADLFFLFKRHAQQIDCEDEPDHEPSEGWENGKQCWEAFKHHKRKCAHCVGQDDGCADYVACTGRGPRPSDSRLAGWWANNSRLGKDKKNKIKTAKKLLFKCLGLKGDRRRK